MGPRYRLLAGILLLAVGASLLVGAFRSPPLRPLEILLGVLAVLGGLYGTLSEPKFLRVNREVDAARRAANELYFHGSRKEALAAFERLVFLYRKLTSMEMSVPKGKDWDAIHRIERELPLIHARMAKLCRDWGDEDGFRRHAGAAMTCAADIKMSPALNYVDDVYAYAVHEDGLTSGKKSLA